MATEPMPWPLGCISRSLGTDVSCAPLWCKACAQTGLQHPLREPSLPHPGCFTQVTDGESEEREETPTLPLQTLGPSTWLQQAGH